MNSPVVLEFDLKLIARKTFSTASYTEKYALQHTESPKESSEGKACISPLQSCNDRGVTLYTTAVHIAGQHLITNCDQCMFQ